MSDFVGEYDFGIDNHEEFMKDFRYNICHIVTVEKAFPWLRHKRVLDEYDEQSILREYNTNYLRAGHMVDILMRRGKRGLYGLLEHIEYEYPEHFQKFTGKEPRTASSEYQPHTTQYRPTSSAILEQICSLNQQVIDTYMAERRSNKMLERTLAQLENQVQTIQKELDMKNQQISELSQKNLELKEQLKHLHVNWEKDKEDKIKCLRECEELRKTKDEYQAKCAQIMSEKGSAARASIKQSSRRDQAYNNLIKENEKLQEELSNYKLHSNLKENANPSGGGKAATDMTKYASILEEKEDLEDQLRSYVEMSERSEREYHNHIQKIRNERDAVLTQFNECKLKCDTLQKDNTRLNEMMSNVNSDLRSMKNEAETWSRDRLQPLNHPHREEVRRPKLVAASESEEDEPPNVGPRRLPVQPQDKMGRRDAILRSPSSANTHPLQISTRNKIKVWTSQVSEEDLIVLRDTCTGRKKSPLALFAPREIVEELERRLLESGSFQRCPYEILESSDILATWLDGGSCIHYTKKGDQYDCIAAQTVRDYMQREDMPRILLCVPPEVLVRMRNQQINAIILLVKYNRLEASSKQSPEERELERIHSDFKFTYEKILIEEGEDLSSAVRNISIKCAASPVERSISATSA